MYFVLPLMLTFVSSTCNNFPKVSLSIKCFPSGEMEQVLEAGKNGLTKDTLRDATSDEVKKLRQENEQLKQSLLEWSDFGALWCTAYFWSKTV